MAWLAIDYNGSQTMLLDDTRNHLVRLWRWKEGDEHTLPQALLKGPATELKRLAPLLGYTPSEVSEVCPDDWD